MRYRIINIREMREQDLEGKTQKVMEIRFEVGQKYRGTISLPHADFTEAKAKKAVREAALVIKTLMESEEEV